MLRTEHPAFYSKNVTTYQDVAYSIVVYPESDEVAIQVSDRVRKLSLSMHTRKALEFIPLKEAGRLPFGPRFYFRREVERLKAEGKWPVNAVSPLV